MSTRRELPLLTGIAGFIRWAEELVAMLSGPLLTIGLGISLVDLLTDGALLTSQPALLYAWAVSQAIGVDAQLVGAWDKARRALRERKIWPLIGLVMLGTALGYVAWVSAQVFGIQQSEGLTTAHTLAQLGMDRSLWLIQRSLLSVLLVALSGWTRYHPPTQASLEDEKASLGRELELEPLRQQARRMRTLGMVGMARDALRTAAQRTPSDTDSDQASAQAGSGTTRNLPTPNSTDVPRSPFPTGGGTPQAARTEERSKRAQADTQRVVSIAKPKRRRLTAAERIARVLERYPDASLDDIVRMAKVGKATAVKYRKVMEQRQVAR